MRIMLVEDDAGTREAMACLMVSCGHEMDGLFSSGEDALEAAAAKLHAPDIALVDLVMPGMSGVETIRGLTALWPGFPILVLTSFENPALTLAAVQAGASGYLLKDASREELAKAVIQVKEGLAPVSPEAARHLFAQLRQAPTTRSAPAEDLLTKRERMVLELLMRGSSYTNVAAALDLRLGTVQTHVKHIYSKLKAASKTEAAWVALKEGIFRP